MAQVTARRQQKGSGSDDDRESDTRKGLAGKLAWFALLWLAGVTTLTVVAGLIRWAIL